MSHRLLTADSLDQSQTFSQEICQTRTGTGTFLSWILRISPVGISPLILHTNLFFCFQNIRAHRIWERLQITHLKHIKIGYFDHKIRRLMVRCFTITPLLLFAWGVLKAAVQSLYLFPISRHSSPTFHFFCFKLTPPPPIPFIPLRLS